MPIKYKMELEALYNMVAPLLMFRRSYKNTREKPNIRMKCIITKYFGNLGENDIMILIRYILFVYLKTNTYNITKRVFSIVYIK